MPNERVTTEAGMTHALRALGSGSRRDELFPECALLGKVRERGTHSPARETRALPGQRRAAFTIIELLIVMSIIIVLASLVLATSGYVQKKGARSRAEAEIAALSAALESYKADNGIYPTSADSDQLDPRATGNPTIYEKASFFLYQELSGREANGASRTNAKSYFSFKPQMLNGTRTSGGDVNPVTAVRDPFGNNYGYSTAKASNPGGNAGYNPTFDIWSTAGGTTGTDSTQWIKNW